MIHRAHYTTDGLLRFDKSRDSGGQSLDISCLNRHLHLLGILSLFRWKDGQRCPRREIETIARERGANAYVQGITEVAFLYLDFKETLYVRTILAQDVGEYLSSERV